MLFGVLTAIVVFLTAAMFFSKSSMLGFPCALFWAIFGGYCYQQSTVTWDTYYLTFFASFGMVIFTMFAAYALKTKKEEAEEGDLYFDEGGDDDIKYIDEDGKGATARDGDDSEKPRKQARGVQERAKRRREKWE